MLGFLVEAALLWFLIVYFSQDHNITYVSLAWKLFLIYTVVGVVAFFVMMITPDSPHQWLKTAVGMIISYGGIGYCLHRYFVKDVKNVLTIMAIYFGGSMAIRYAGEFLLKWHHNSSMG